jgi:lipase ATG15
LGLEAWTVDKLWGPNVTDKETVLSMARIAADAYVTDNNDAEWQDVGGGFNYTEDFGWDNDGLRGHVFADTQNETVVIGIKGTTPAVFDGTETTTNDKINDNLFFSCCCGQGGQYTWHQVCDCQTSAYKCNSTCVTKALRNKNRYYYAAQEIYRNVSQIYPNADIWLAGHSLGGSTSSLVGLTYGLPVVTFEAPGEALPAVRLGLPAPPGYQAGFGDEEISTGGWHFGHTADPIFMGTCNTFSSVCTIAGYAMQSRCHTGLTCIYDTVGDFGWRSSSTTHKIVSVIKDVLLKYDNPAKCEAMVNCTDCFNWEFYESNHTDKTTTSSSSTSTRTTRTSTCKTPGWWGCLDETTTTTDSVSTRSDFSTSITTELTTTTATTWTTTTTTSHCLSPGWFGCKDAASSTTSTTASETEKPPSPSSDATITGPEHTSTSASKSASTSTCKDPGWFGCNDPVSTTTEIHTTTVTETSTSLTVTTDSPSPSPTSSPTSAASESSSCTSRKYFGLVCADPTSASATQTKTEAARPTSRPAGKKCVRRSWVGTCKEWRWEGGDGEWSSGPRNVDL